MNQHFQDRVLERYGIDIDDAEFNLIVQRIKAGVCFPVGPGSNWFFVMCAGKMIAVACKKGYPKTAVAPQAVHKAARNARRAGVRQWLESREQFLDI